MSPVIAWLAGACVPPAQRDPKPLDLGTETSSPESSGEKPGLADPAPPAQIAPSFGLPARTVLLAENVSGVGAAVPVGDLTGDGTPDLIVTAAPHMWLLPAPLPSGWHVASDLSAAYFLDGSSSYGISAAGDVTGDGIGDLWVAGWLYAGPILGDMPPHGEGWWAHLNGLANGGVVGNIDADGDGALDVYLHEYGMGQLWYGPITQGGHATSGAWVYGYPEDLVVTTLDAEMDCGLMKALALGSVNTPDEFVLTAAWGLGCSDGVFLFDVAGRKGDTIGRGEALALFGSPTVMGADIDGDGLTEIFYDAMALDRPVRGYDPQGPEVPAFDNAGACLLPPVAAGDVSGDGGMDLFVTVVLVDQPDQPEAVVVLPGACLTETGSVFDLGVMLDIDGANVPADGTFADVDGDGIDDPILGRVVVPTGPGVETDARTYIWSGAMIRSLLEQRENRCGLPD